MNERSHLCHCDSLDLGFKQVFRSAERSGQRGGSFKSQHEYSLNDIGRAAIENFASRLVCSDAHCTRWKGQIKNKSLRFIDINDADPIPRPSGCVSLHVRDLPLIFDGLKQRI